jgi:hypothetical protein
MTREDAEIFRQAAPAAYLYADAVRFAVENLASVAYYAEHEVVEYFTNFELVFAVWYNRAVGIFQVKRIKGTDVRESATFNAIPVADEAEAIKWSALLNAEAPPQRPAGLHLH